MALSRRQLRAIFAKLNLLRKGAPSRTQETTTAAKRVRLGIEQRDVVALVSRLPERHRSISQMRDFRLHNERSMLTSWAGEGSRVSGSPPVGYFDHASGTLHVRVDPLPYISPVGYSSKPAHIPRGISGTSPRNTRLGATKVFYHEYGHSVNSGSLFSAKREWAERGAREWERTDPKEAWSEAYALYTTNKQGRNRLRRERPASYAYMKQFFGD